MSIDRSRLHPECAELVRVMGGAELVDPDDITAEGMRESLRDLSRLGGPGPDLYAVTDETAPRAGRDVPVRLYRPAAGDRLGAVMMLHGGGFVMGDLSTYDATCRKLAAATGLLVCSVDYALAPEEPFPAALDDAMAAFDFLAAHSGRLGIAEERIGVGGDSAGGCLAASVAIVCRDRGGAVPAHQLLIYPCLDARCDTESFRQNGRGFLLTDVVMRWFWRQYLGDTVGAPPRYAAPLDTPDLAGVAPATIITAEFDPLRDEGEAFAQRLAAAGVPVACRRFDGMIHGFFGMVENPAPADDAPGWAYERLRSELGA